MSDGGDHDDEGKWRNRLRSAGGHVEACREALGVAIEQRDEIVVDAVDAGISTRDVARWADISQSRVTQVLGTT